MKHYKDINGKIYAYESDGSQDEFIKPGLEPISEQEALVIANPPPSPEQILEQQTQEERFWRDGELSRADIELNKVQDNDINAVALVGDWRTYRKELRAWPESPDFPDSTKRPIAPDASV